MRRNTYLFFYGIRGVFFETQPSFTVKAYTLEEATIKAEEKIVKLAKPYTADKWIYQKDGVEGKPYWIFERGIDTKAYLSGKGSILPPRRRLGKRQRLVSKLEKDMHERILTFVMPVIRDIIEKAPPISELFGTSLKTDTPSIPMVIILKTSYAKKRPKIK